MRSVLIKVGVCKSNENSYSPVIEGNIEYISKKMTEEYSTTSKLPVYSEIQCQNGELLREQWRKFVAKEHWNSQTHVDPEFETFTYGETDQNSMNLMKELNIGDYIFFCSAFGERILERKNFSSEMKISDFNLDKDTISTRIFGFFKISNILHLEDQNNISKDDMDLISSTKTDHINNIFPSATNKNKKLTLVFGNKEESAIFSKGFRITDKSFVLKNNIFAELDLINSKRSHPDSKDKECKKFNRGAFLLTEKGTNAILKEMQTLPKLSWIKPISHSL